MIYLIGDTHGEMEINKLSNKRNAPMKENDVVIVLGDFGLIFNNMTTSEESYWLNWLESKPFYTLFIDGNHDNHNKINSNLLEFINENNIKGKFHKINSKVFHIPRGTIFYINDISFLGIGGAISIDKSKRKENIDWWSTELISSKEQRIIEDTIENNDKVDYILTHTCPQSLFNTMYKEYGFTQFYDPTTKILEYVKDNIEFKHWYFGHFHLDNKFDNKFTCVYYDFIRIK